MFSSLLFPVQVMAQQARAGKRYLRAFVSGFFVAVPVTVTVLDRFACVARVEGASMQVSPDDANTAHLCFSSAGRVAECLDNKELQLPAGKCLKEKKVVFYLQGKRYFSVCCSKLRLFLQFCC